MNFNTFFLVFLASCSLLYAAPGQRQCSGSAANERITPDYDVCFAPLPECYRNYWREAGTCVRLFEQLGEHVSMLAEQPIENVDMADIQACIPEFKEAQKAHLRMIDCHEDMKKHPISNKKLCYFFAEVLGLFGDVKEFFADDPYLASLVERYLSTDQDLCALMCESDEASKKFERDWCEIKGGLQSRIMGAIVDIHINLQNDIKELEQLKLRQRYTTLLRLKKSGALMSMQRLTRVNVCVEHGLCECDKPMPTRKSAGQVLSAMAKTGVKPQRMQITTSTPSMVACVPQKRVPDRSCVVDSHVVYRPHTNHPLKSLFYGGAHTVWGGVLAVKNGILDRIKNGPRALTYDEINDLIAALAV